jgi:hypothetical protein
MEKKHFKVASIATKMCVKICTLRRQGNVCLREKGAGLSHTPTAKIVENKSLNPTGQSEYLILGNLANPFSLLFIFSEYNTETIRLLVLHEWNNMHD